MADGTVQVVDAVGTKEIDNEVVERDGVNVYRQRVVTMPPRDETRFDYDARTDGNPVYVGSAVQGASTAVAAWTIRKFTYDASDRPTRIQTLIGIWDDRASLGWS